MFGHDITDIFGSLSLSAASSTNSRTRAIGEFGNGIDDLFSFPRSPLSLARDVDVNLGSNLDLRWRGLRRFREWGSYTRILNNSIKPKVRRIIYAHALDGVR